MSAPRMETREEVERRTHDSSRRSLVNKQITSDRLDVIRTQVTPVVQEIFEDYVRNHIFPRWWRKNWSVYRLREHIRLNPDFFGGWYGDIHWTMGPLHLYINVNQKNERSMSVAYGRRQWTSDSRAIALGEVIRARIPHVLLRN